MKILFKRGKQKELILNAKKDLTWKELAQKIGINDRYLCGDIKNEKRCLSEEVYRKLCGINGLDFDNFIEKKLKDNWGQSKGGVNSPGSTIKIPKVNFNEKFSEFIGAVLGDGHVCYIKSSNKQRKIGVYQIRIAGDLIKDKEYHNYLKNLGEEIFNLKGKEIKRPKNNERFLEFTSKKLIELFISIGINPGNKIKNQSTIPKWIFKNKRDLRTCLRGLIDTDGCIHRMSKKDPKLIRINFTNHNETLLKDTREGFILLGFNPSKIICNKHFFISRQKEIEKYVKEIGFKNLKHLKRLEQFSPFL